MRIYAAAEYSTPHTQAISCHWPDLRNQILEQWERIAANDLDAAGPDRERIARLIAQKYGIAAPLIENYLCNFERTMPLSANDR